MPSFKANIRLQELQKFALKDLERKDQDAEETRRVRRFQRLFASFPRGVRLMKVHASLENSKNHN